jgi:aspartyl-tRNA(Asn)/glutamyl-tRNA(Gln) amidotransferase subunit B
VIDWLKKLTLSLSYLKAVDSNAGIKVDVNVSIPKKSERVEVKNLSSIESIGKAINYELERQMNESCKQKETRRYDDSKGKTILMRSKEDAEDYRFISDPDLKSINIDKKYIQELEESMPEGPEEKLSKLIKKYKIDKKNAEILSKNIDIVEFFEKVAESVGADFALSWVSIELLRFLNYNKKKLHEVEIDLEHFVELLNLVKSDKITPLKGKEMLNKFYPKSFMPKIEGEKISDEKELEKIIKIVISKNSKAVSDYKNGEKNAFNFLMGEIMKESKKMADFVVARKVLERMLK